MGVFLHPQRMEETGGEAIIPEFKIVTIVSMLPLWLKSTVAWVCQHVLKEPRVGWYMSLRPPTTSTELFELINRQAKATQDFFDFLLEKGIDAWISPTFPVPAVLHGGSKYLQAAAINTYLHNVLDLPTACLPIKLVCTHEQGYSDPKHLGDRFEAGARRTCEGSVGLPLGIQVSCLPYEDEKVCGIAKQLEKIFKFPYLPRERINQYKPDVTAAK